MTAIVSISRLLDALVTGAFVVCLSGLSLYVLSLFYKFVVVTERARTGVFGNFLQNSLPFKHNRFEYNLTHVLLFAILITLFTLCHHKYLDELEKKESKSGKTKGTGSRKETGIASLSTALRGFATAARTSSDIETTVKGLISDIKTKENEDTGDADPLAVAKVVEGAKAGELEEPVSLNKSSLADAAKAIQPTLYDSAANTVVGKLCEIDAVVSSLEDPTSTQGSGRVGRYTPGNGKTAAVITDADEGNLLKAVTDSAMAVALGYSPVTLYCPDEVAPVARVLLVGRGVEVVTKEVTPSAVQDAAVISCASSCPRSCLFSTDDDVTSSTTKVQALGRWSQAPAWMRLGRLFNRGDTTSKYELPLLAEDALTFLEPASQKKFMEVLDETLD
ncbi:hypothetical protein FOZ63_007356, partial [Perkinsus olseni]